MLPEIDRLEMNYLLADLEHVQQRYLELEPVPPHEQSRTESVNLQKPSGVIGVAE